MRYMLMCGEDIFNGKRIESETTPCELLYDLVL